MTNTQQEIAHKCLQGAESGDMSFPEIVSTLLQNGFESYRIDFLRCTAIYYHTDDSSVELPTHSIGTKVGRVFDVSTVQSAIREAQQQVEGYTYLGFCQKVMAAGCVGYIVSFPGRRAVYLGRTAEVYVEHFPQ